MFISPLGEYTSAGFSAFLDTRSDPDVLGAN
jgi:hypothetical protein